ncbi:phosphoribosyltransferase family protein [Lactiplantibacillus fabifermentans]|uniref:Adenine phosphoribosyltransferase n=2 Tax=Lactiplantibacillus fabifermentans TaxID=483011 RepID=A0A0R2NNZ6_9LACO|nr:phosphoribosyltransferase family protein [Lactiplantibacillus fabifermentans]ETY73559.1 adenine phosphoribosyltransferase [Lactiplantibacillus fabifermentans T30PCM01]KRO27446.1 adenine phosphoribosyltransferase [Lactiplantibacillus fabifermentans DSM 21115]
MPTTYELKLGPLTRQLPLIKLNATTTIASFVLLGDAELTDYAATELTKRLQSLDFDYLVTMESKGIPLAQALSERTHHPRFIVLRKSIKDYMQTPLTAAVSAITTSADQELVLDGTDANLLRGKRVVIVDDVISTGGSLATAHQLLTRAQAQVVGQLAILAEGAAADRNDITYLGKLPLFES